MTPQPSVYSRAQIVLGAFELLREKGWSSVSTRTIANKIGCSTMPIYSHVKSVEELEKELRKKAMELMKEYQQKKYTEHILLNLAFGYVIFARDERSLFQFLYQERPDKVELGGIHGMKDTFLKNFGQDSEEGRALSKMQKTEQELLIQYTWIFTHGLANLANSGILDYHSDQLILKYLMNAGEAFYYFGMKQSDKEEQ